MTLDKAPIGAAGVIETIDIGNPNLVRLAELGLIEGERVEVLKRAPLGDPIEVRLMHYTLCLRNEDAAGVRLRKESQT